MPPLIPKLNHPYSPDINSRQMNESFSMNRFWLLVRRQWSENRKVYLLQWIVISLFVTVLQFFDKITEPYIFYLLLFCLGGCAVATTLFSRWTDKGRSSLYLLLPATASEKFLCALFYGILLFIPVFCLNYFVFRYIVTWLVILPFKSNLISFPEMISLGIHEVIATPIPNILVFFLMFLFIQSIFMIIFIRLRRYQALVCLITILAILIIYNYGMGIFVRQFVTDFAGSIRPPGLFLTFFSSDFWFQPYKSFSGEHFSFTRLIWILNDVVWFIVFCILYLAAGCKLREREI
jgi:hypothetical protein